MDERKRKPNKFHFTIHTCHLYVKADIFLHKLPQHKGQIQKFSSKLHIYNPLISKMTEKMED